MDGMKQTLADTPPVCMGVCVGVRVRESCAVHATLCCIVTSQCLNTLFDHVIVFFLQPHTRPDHVSHPPPFSRLLQLPP